MMKDVLDALVQIRCQFVHPIDLYIARRQRVVVVIIVELLGIL